MLTKNRVDSEVLSQAAAAVQLIDPVLAGRLRAMFDLPEPATPQGLTEREGQVARLAAAGLTNHQISRQLVISVRTVECHLARVYHKLGVSSRRELATRVYTAE